MPLLLTGAFLTSLSLSLVGTYAVRGWAIRRGFVDHPNDDRRIHSSPTPNVGGIAIVAATLLSFTAWAFFIVPDFFARPEILGMLVGGALIFLVGFRDDTRPLKATTKFVLQFAVAIIALVLGVRIMGLSFGSVWATQLTAVASWVVTVVWIVGTTNAFNLIDGSDGVAGGAALFASLAMGVIFALHADPLGALMATVLVGACLGFLFFNFPPASVFMGDCGSLFLGYTLASLAVITTQKASTLVAIAIPVVAFGVPLMDTAIAIVRRYLRHEPIFAPDRGHIHHRLRDLGMSSRRVAVFLYVACAGCASLSLLLAAPGRGTVVPVFVVAGAVLILGVQRLNVPELTELSRVLGRGLQQRAVISHNVRIHGLASSLETASNADEVVDAIRDALKNGEFSAVEIGVEAPHVLVATPASDLESDGSRSRVRVVFDRVLHPDQEYEIRVPVVLSDHHLGYISLFRRSSGSKLFTDVRLVAKLIGPAIAAAVDRMPVDLPGSSAQQGQIKG